MSAKAEIAVVCDECGVMLESILSESIAAFRASLKHQGWTRSKGMDHYKTCSMKKKRLEEKR